MGIRQALAELIGAIGAIEMWIEVSTIDENQKTRLRNELSRIRVVAKFLGDIR